MHICHSSKSSKSSKNPHGVQDLVVVNLCMSLDCVRKPEYLERTHRYTQRENMHTQIDPEWE